MRIKEQFEVEKQQSETRALSKFAVKVGLFFISFGICAQEKALLWRERAKMQIHLVNHFSPSHHEI
jgi:hypothetical protein